MRKNRAGTGVSVGSRQAPSSVRELVCRARALERDRRFADAATLYRRVGRSSTASIAAHLGLARCLAQMERWPLIPAALTDAVRAGAPRFVTLFEGGNRLLAAGRFAEAIELFREAGRDRTSSRRSQDTARLHYNNGYACARLGRQFAAVRAYQRCLEITPDSNDAWFNLGSVYSGTGALRLARDAYDQAVNLDRDDHEAWNNLGNACAALTEASDAIGAYRRALAIKPGYHPAWNNLGNVMQTLDDHDEAIRCYDRAIMLQGGMEVITLFNRALSLFSSGRTREGLRDLNRWALVPPLPESGSLPAMGPDWAGLVRDLSSPRRCGSAL